VCVYVYVYIVAISNNPDSGRPVFLPKTAVQLIFTLDDFFQL